MKVSVIIPTYNEEEVIEDCLTSLSKQSFKDMEIIVVDDGSTDKTLEAVTDWKIKNKQSFPFDKSKRGQLKILKQKHKGPGEARNLGAEHTSGDILVFIDADMIFDRKFIEMLTRPIRSGKVIGTFSKNEYVLNKSNTWSKCWNINKNLPVDRMHSRNHPDIQPVFRAIFKKEFERAGGFKPIGYVDDYTISEKIGVMAKSAPGAILYHRNPATLNEVFRQARWIGKSEYKKRKIENEFIMRMIAIIRYSVPFTILIGLIKSLRYRIWQFFIFKIIYDFGIELSLIKSFFGEQRYK